MKSLGKIELAEQLANKTGMNKKESKEFLDAFIDVISDNLKAGNKVTITGFGIFGVKDRAARTAKNPRTGEKIYVPAKRVPYFKAGANLKDAVH